MGSKAKLSVNVDRDALDVIDRYVAEHSSLDRSKVVNAALHQWLAEQQREAIRAQFVPLDDDDDQDVLEQDTSDWDAIRDAAAARQFTGSQS